MMFGWCKISLLTRNSHGHSYDHDHHPPPPPLIKSKYALFSTLHSDSHFIPYYNIHGDYPHNHHHVPESIFTTTAHAHTSTNQHFSSIHIYFGSLFSLIILFSTIGPDFLLIFTIIYLLV